jgi:hypothetical protein
MAELDVVDGLLVEVDGLDVAGGVGEEDGLAGEAQALGGEAGDAAEFGDAGGDGLFGIGEQLRGGDGRARGAGTREGTILRRRRA